MHSTHTHTHTHTKHTHAHTHVRTSAHTHTHIHANTQTRACPHSVLTGVSVQASTVHDQFEVNDADKKRQNNVN